MSLMPPPTVPIDRDFVQRLPKAELHLHLEGTLEPELMFELAERNSIPLPYASIAQVQAAYQFTNLQSFLDVYYQGASVLQKSVDFCDLTWAYCQRAAEQGVRHAEVFFDPQTHTARGIPFATVIEGIAAGLARARHKLQLSSRIILCFLRHLSAADAMQTLEQAGPYRDLITAVGLDSAEAGNPPSRFTEVFAAARLAGFLTVAHAGEEGPAEYVREALDCLQAQRIDHGVRCLEDPQLVARLVREQIPLTVCPLSNVRLHVVPSLADHPLRKLIDAGLLVTINSDDPAYFGGYIADNYRACQTGLHLDRQDLVTLARNSFVASFLPATEKRRLIDELEAFVTAAG